jgi:hypothetical protein
MKTFSVVMLALIVSSLALTTSMASEEGKEVSFTITSVPRDMSYQGILKDDTGTPVTDTTVNITFRIYDDPSVGDLEWSEVVGITTDDGGYFTATLSNVNISFDEDYWMELEIDGQILTPRQALTMTAYAAVSDTADYAHASDLALPYSKTISAPSTAFSITNTNGNGGHFIGGGVGLKAEASDGIAVWGECSHSLLPAILGTNHNNGIGLSGVSEGTGYGVYGQGNDGVGVYGSSVDGYAGYFDGDLFADGRVFIVGDVGIGIGTPAVKLDVGDMMRIQDNNYPDFPTSGAGLEMAYREYDNTGIIQAYDRDSSEWGDLYLGDGNVGIGTSNPDAKLHVTDSVKIDGPLISPFPRPVYDSGWFYLAAGDDTTINHNVGGHTGDYFVDFQQKRISNSAITNYCVGGDKFSLAPLPPDFYGAYYTDLTSTQITVHRYNNNAYANQFRVRIWVIQ